MPAPRTEPAHSFLYQPANLAAVAMTPDIADLLNRITPALKNPFNKRQQEAFRASFTNRLSLIWGPPGTGKTTVLAGIILGWLEHAAANGRPVRIGVGAANYNAIDNVLKEVADLLTQFGAPHGLEVKLGRIRNENKLPPNDKRIEDFPRDSSAATKLAEELAAPRASAIIGGTWMQLVKLCRKMTDPPRPAAPWFDLFIIDEASQMKVAAAGAYFLLLANDAHVVLAGDDKQLGPIYGFAMSAASDRLYDCIFTHLKAAHSPPLVALNENYRNNLEIARWPEQRFYQGDLQAQNPARRLSLTLPPYQDAAPSWWPSRLPWTKEYWRLLDPALPVAIITYPAMSYTLSNPFEAQLVAALARLYRQMLAEQASVGDDEFWEKRLGIVTPHRAQMASIRNLLIEAAGFSRQPIPAVDTVDRFQGLERDLIISSYSVADTDFIRSEEEFILDARRFNVTLTRSCSKFLMFISDPLVQHLPSDLEVAQTAAHLQLFVQSYCAQVEKVELPFRTQTGEEQVPCRLRTP